MRKKDDENIVLLPRQIAAIESLLRIGDPQKAAVDAGVSKSAMYRWIREDVNFRTVLKLTQKAAIESLSITLTGLATDATESLRVALKDEKTSNQLRAAEIVLNNLLRVIEVVNASNPEENKDADAWFADGFIEAKTE